jgi:peptide/nickel transport system substrate-binding protein
MNNANSWLLAALLLLATMPYTATAQTLRWASQGDMQTLDPHAQNDALSNSLNAHLYKRLTARDEKLALVPGLAQRWEQVDGLTWRFYLRSGVRFHDGTALDADDVVFSVQRAQHANSGIAQYARALGAPAKLAPGVVEFKLTKPNPVLLDHADAVFIMSKAWCVAHGVAIPLSRKEGQETYALRNANGTGPFILVRREPDVRTVFTRNGQYWAQVPGNVKEMVFTPIGSAAARNAALLSGAVDLVIDPAPQDLEPLAKMPDIQLRTGVENRVIFLGFDQQRDELLYSSTKGRNPLKDLRVRQAMAHAIDAQALHTYVMRKQSVVTGCMTPSPLACIDVPELDANRLAYDLTRARALLVQAGYPQGFDITLDCPNNRYLNDEALCAAMASMLAKVNIKVRVNAMPRAQFFAKLEKLDTSFYLLGWGGAETDARPTMDPLMHSFDAASGRGDDNNGRFSDPKLDTLIESAATEVNVDKRKELVRQALLLHHGNVYHLVLHRQMLTWAMRRTVSVEPAANNHLRSWLVRINPAGVAAAAAH